MNSLSMVPQKKKTQRMSKIYCPCCNSNKNTFPVDQAGFFVIRLCIDCAREQGFKINLDKGSTCASCGKKFMAKGSWQKTCPICYMKNVKGGFQCKK
jgi:hypothetical protein